MIRVAFLLEGNPKNWMGGVNYLRNLVEAIMRLDDRRITPVLFCGKQFPQDVLDEFPLLEINRSTLLDRKSLPWVGRRILRQLRLPSYFLYRLLKQKSIDVLSHSSEGEQLLQPMLQIGWVPDFQHMHLPHFFPGHQLAAREYALRQVCEKSDRIVVSSHCAQQDLMDFYPEMARKSEVLQFAVPMPAASNLLSEAVLRHKYGLEGNYVYIPNQFWAHKNHQLIVEALGLLKAEGVLIQCVMTGGGVDSRNPEFLANLMKRVSSLGVDSEFKVLGVVPYREVLSLMRYAHSVLNPSLFEGWSTTVEEAKAMGKLLLLSDIPVHREQAGDIAHFFNKDSPDALAQVLRDTFSMVQSHNTGDADVSGNSVSSVMGFANAYQRLILSLYDTCSSI